MTDPSRHLRPVHYSLQAPPLNLKCEGPTGIIALSLAIASMFFLPNWPMKIVLTIVFLAIFRGLQLIAAHDPIYLRRALRHMMRYKNGYSPLPHLDAKRRTPRGHQRTSAL